jgi:endonuclease/exonuclease/phosphatase family metal-dependent hydrolase
LEFSILPDPALRLMTFNLLSSTKLRRTHPWRLRKRSAARIFRHFLPDVVGTQEANLPQLRQLAELLPEYDFLGEGNLAGLARLDSLRNWYCAIFYRRETVRPAESEGDSYWLSPTPAVPASQFHFGTRPRLVTWQTFEHIPSRREFIFGTTHLEAINGWHRQKSARLLREYFRKKIAEKGSTVPMFLTGDFNAESDSPEIRALGDPRRPGDPDSVRLYDAWREAGSDDLFDGATFRGLGRWGQVGRALLGPRRIDYIFYRPQLQVLEAKRIEFDRLISRQCALPSDHFPVMADFALPERPRR